MVTRARIAARRLPQGGTVCKCKNPAKIIVKPAKKPTAVKAPKGVKLKDPGKKNPGKQKLKPDTKAAKNKGKGKGTSSPCDCHYFGPQ